jgi:hypothetical protein
MNVFFELADCAVKDFGGKYFALYNTHKGKVVMAHERYLMSYSERVWAEEEDGVRYLKNRFTGVEDSPIDMKEFFWIKLKSKTI